MTTDTKCTTSAEEQPAVSQITSEEDGAQPPQKERGPSMRVITCFLVILALPHFILGGVSAGTGIILFGRAASTWLAYTVAPIWSGGCVSYYYTRLDSSPNPVYFSVPSPTHQKIPPNRDLSHEKGTWIESIIIRVSFLIT